MKKSEKNFKKVYFNIPVKTITHFGAALEICSEGEADMKINVGVKLVDGADEDEYALFSLLEGTKVLYPQKYGSFGVNPEEDGIITPYYGYTNEFKNNFLKKGNCKDVRDFTPYIKKAEITYSDKKGLNLHTGKIEKIPVSINGFETIERHRIGYWEMRREVNPPIKRIRSGNHIAPPESIRYADVGEAKQTFFWFEYGFYHVVRKGQTVEYNVN